MLAINYIKNQLWGIWCFDIEVLRKYLWSPKYDCIFCSDSYWTIKWENFQIPFGTIEHKTLILWGIDYQDLPDSDKIHFKDNKINLVNWIEKVETTDFYKGQMECVFTEPILEVSLYQKIDILNNLWDEKIGYKLFKNNSKSIDEILDLSIKYKKIILWSFDDFRSFITDWHILTLEWLDKKLLENHANSLTITIEKDYWSRIILENILIKLEFTKIDSFKILNDVRNYVDHRNNKKKEEIYNQFCNSIWIEKNNYIEIYYYILVKLNNDIDNLTKNINKTDELFYNLNNYV